jgi:PHD/YefM family antitoxin component YafN of YafNO toxin-antitoxin module
MEVLYTILEEIQDTYEPLIIAGEKHSAVLISEDVWRSIEETLYLSSIPGMKKSIISGMKEKIEDCTSTIEW